MHRQNLPRRLCPIPGTQPPPRGLFIDRWGTLLEEPNGAFEPFERARFTSRALDALFRVSRTGWRLYLIGNEDAVARGSASDGDWASFETALLAHLRHLGITVTRNYACLEDPIDGRGPHRKGSVFRLPDTGVFFHAVQNDGVALRHSFVIGDSTLEIAAGARAGCRTIAVRTGAGGLDRALAVEPDIQVETLADGLELFLRSEACMGPA